MAFQDQDQKSKSPHFRLGEEDPVNLVETPETAENHIDSAAENTGASAGSTISPSAQSDTSAGDATTQCRIEGYKLIEIIAHGSSGDVWHAADVHGAPVAIKVFKKELATDSENLRRFHQEAKNLARINNPNVVSVIGSGETADHSPYIAMELLTGKTLKSKIEDEGVFEPKTAVTIAREICRALLAAHEQTIIHRDLKPSNIIVTDFNMTKLIDFGVAKATGYSGETITQVGEVVGTPAYMSPEQCLGGLVDERSDIYSLGCTLFEMLTGFKAFPSNSTVEAIAKQVSNDRAEVQANIKATGIPAPLQQIVLKCLERDPAKRFQNVSQLENDLGAFLLGAPLRFTKRQPPSPVTGKALRLSLAASSIFLLLVGVCMWQTMNTAPTSGPPLASGLSADALPAASLSDYRKWIEHEVAERGNVVAVGQNSLTDGMNQALASAMKQEPVARSPDGEGAVYFTLNSDGKVSQMSAVGWRNKRGYVSDRGPTISSVEDSLRSANFSAPDKDKQMALL
ncbi:MAG TPA: serine/threonine-protein kinase, partial [Trichormus sp.]